MLVLHKFGANRNITFELATYLDNGNLYVGLIENEDGYAEPWSDLTVNLGVKCKDNCAFIDTNNNGDEIVDWLFENKLGHFTGEMQPSGWCVYPEFEFNMEELMRHVVRDARSNV